MSKIVVCGLVNVETSAYVESFPVEYRPIDYRNFAVNTNPAGVGLNISLALNTLGDDVALCSMCGNDLSGKLIKDYLLNNGISTDNILSKNKSTAQSVVLYDNSGRRYIICDLTDNQDLSYDENTFRSVLQGADLVALCNINFSASLIPVAKELNVPIATDVHCLWDVYDNYNARFMSAADILFLSNENILGREEDFVRELSKVYPPSVIVVGMGGNGALLYTRCDDTFTHFPAVYTRPVINTVGAGDSLYSAFLHFYAQCNNPHLSLHRAMYFASYKIGESGASKGFLTEAELLKITEKSGV